MGSYSNEGCHLAEVDNFFNIRSFPPCVKELIAGGASGAFAKTAVAPLERIKILLQARTEGYYSTGVCQSMKKVVKIEGFRGLYKGNAATVLRVVPYSGFHYMAYERYRGWIVESCPSLGTGPVVDLLAGSAAGGTAVFCTYPLDLARTKLAYQVVDRHQFFMDGKKGIYTPTYNGIQDVFKKVYQESGVRAFYRGLGPTVVGILPYAGLKYYVYEELKRKIPEEDQNSIVLSLACGASAALFGQTLTYPLDVVRRQMQIDYVQQGAARYKNTWHGLASIVRSQGWRQLYAGYSINYMKVVPSVAIGFTTYDVLKSRLQNPSQAIKGRTALAFPALRLIICIVDTQAAVSFAGCGDLDCFTRSAAIALVVTTWRA
ncbi:Mitochondrial carrier protein CoAc1 [Turnera subulata]|uniref:Mitochondrial carrier protein CoAc1 n=1 Tax=Turnera subulata TaxID=218843 RepID=A0A9Q0JRU5_9ROSI|nr:Mitochondrial carrier protein CoAc1 [Turnera subulata]